MSSELTARNGDDLEVSPLHRIIIQDLIWAEECYAKGDFAAFPGQFVGIVDKKIHAVGPTIREVSAKAASSAGVPLERVALFHVDAGQWL